MPKYKEIVAKVEVRPEITLGDLFGRLMAISAEQKIEEKEEVTNNQKS